MTNQFMRIGVGKHLTLSLALLMGIAACSRQSEDRAENDLEFTHPQTCADVTFQVETGLAVFKRLEPGTLELWQSAPVIQVRATSAATAAQAWTIAVNNCMPAAVASANLVSGPPVSITPALPADPTLQQWTITLQPGDDVVIDIRPPDWDVATPFAFAFLSDVQEAIDHLPGILNHIEADTDIRFVLSAGDLAMGVTDSSYSHERVQGLLFEAGVALYAVPGNHDVDSGNTSWRQTFGRSNVFFSFKGVYFVGVDSASSSVAPEVYEWLDTTWLPSANPGVCVFTTHIPPFDPVGERNIAFASRKEAAKLVSLLAEHDVDLCLYGHIHTFHAFTNGGIPAYISGGGGAWPVGLDGIGRHYLKVVVDSTQVYDVGVVRME